jgi:hypothetical protein
MKTTHVPGAVFTSETLSANRSLTPEGFLHISDVPIARVGQQIYAAHELPRVRPSADGLIIVERHPKDVFRPETLGSFNGKPFTDDHPHVGMVTPDSWRTFAKGSVFNVRQGDGLKLDNDFMFADVLVTDADTIKSIESGKKEVSAGYDADYEEIVPGRARCMNIIGNHVALVDRGRCGPHCAVGDSEMAAKSSNRSRFMDRFRSAVKRGSTRDALEAVSEVQHDPELLGEIISDEIGDLPERGGDGDDKKHHIETHVHLNGMPQQGQVEAVTKDDPTSASGQPAAGGDLASAVQALTERVGNIENMLMQLADEGDGQEAGGMDRRASKDENEGGEGINSKSAEGPKYRDEGQGEGYHEEKGAPELPRDAPGTQDRRRVTADSASMREAFIATLSKAETLCPGIRLPTFDAALPATETFDALCSFRRKTLDAAYKTDNGHRAIEAVIEGRKAQFFDKTWTCDAVAITFNSAAALISKENAHRAVNPRVGGTGGSNGFGAKPPTIAEMNARARKFYGQDA